MSQNITTDLTDILPLVERVVEEAYTLCYMLNVVPDISPEPEENIEAYLKNDLVFCREQLIRCQENLRVIKERFNDTY